MSEVSRMDGRSVVVRAGAVVRLLAAVPPLICLVAFS